MRYFQCSLLEQMLAGKSFIQAGEGIMSPKMQRMIKARQDF